MAEGVGLREEGAVGVAVQRDPAEAEGTPDGIDVVGGRAGVVRLEIVAEPASAFRQRDPFGGAARLQVGAADRPRQPGPPHVDEDQLAVVEEPAEQLRERVRGAGAGVSGASFDGDDRPPRRRPAVVTRTEGEADLERPLLGRRAELRDPDRAAPEAADHRQLSASLQRGAIDALDRGGRGVARLAAGRRDPSQCGVAAASAGKGGGGQQSAGGERSDPAAIPAGKPSLNGHAASLTGAKIVEEFAEGRPRGRRGGRDAGRLASGRRRHAVELAEVVLRSGSSARRPTFASICSGFVAPAITEAMAGWAARPAIATSIGSTPRSFGEPARASRSTSNCSSVPTVSRPRQARRRWAAPRRAGTCP